MSYQTTFTTALIHAIVTAKKIDPPPRRADRVQWLADYGYEWTGAAYERLGDTATPEWASPLDNPYHRTKCDCDARSPAIAVIVCVWRDSVYLNYAVCGECLIWERFNRDEIDIATARRLIRAIEPIGEPTRPPVHERGAKSTSQELLERAEALDKWRQEQGLSWRKTAYQLGYKSIGAIQHMMETAQLPTYLKEKVLSGEYNVNQARRVATRERIKSA